MATDDLIALVRSGVPPGRWGVAVSGGADSVALLLLLHGQPNLWLQVVHLDHETRDGESGVDAQFVASLAARLKLPCVIERRSTIEAKIQPIKKNLSARFRQARFRLFEQTAIANQLAGIILGHHADDQAETILQRILRGAGGDRLGGMHSQSTMGSLRVLRPMLGIRAAELRGFLHQREQNWREDLSNQSDHYQRNRLRRWLVDYPQTVEELLSLGRVSRVLDNWLSNSAPKLEPVFAVAALNHLPGPIATRAAARWLVKRGSPTGDVTQQTSARLIEMATDAASPSRQQFPGALSVRRKEGFIFVDGT